jgi:hypothetical protein
MPKALSGLRGRLAAAVSLYVAHYNLCRVHETLTPSAKQQTTPAMALGLTAHPWLIGDLLDAALAVAPADPTHRSGGNNFG